MSYDWLISSDHGDNRVIKVLNGRCTLLVVKKAEKKANNQHHQHQGQKQQIVESFFLILFCGKQK